jgi:carbonic anhydrase/acetyltransferase-like protein (isoleucine patch superfamily)
MKGSKRFTTLSPVRGRFRPWLWPWRLFGRLTNPVQPGVWLINVFVQRILRINSSVPWMVHFTSVVWGRVSIGRDVWKSFAVSPGCYVQGHNGVNIGDDTIFGPGIKIISANHDPDNLDGGWLDAEPVNIGKRCWIGANAVILPGVQLGDDVIIGAGAVVTKSFPSGSVIAGVPAQVVSVRDRGRITANDIKSTNL